jgi:hypothetical protein
MAEDPSTPAAIMHTTPLAGPLSDEPSIAVGRNGTLVVAAPAAGTGPKNVVKGGYVWVSRDGGASFKLEVNPDEPLDRGGFCSCDTDVAADGGRLFATTMTRTVNPVFNANVIRSIDEGRSWSTRSPAAAMQPIDRPWLTTTPAGDLLLAYTRAESLVDLAPRVFNESLDLGPYSAGSVYLQRSEDGGRTWSSPRVVAQAGPDTAYTLLEPVAGSNGDVLVPLEKLRRGSDDARYSIARIVPGKDEIQKQRIASDIEPYARFGLNLGTNGNRTVAAWAGPAESGPAGSWSMHTRTSSDGGATWGPPRELETAGNAVQPWVTVREDGWTAIAHYGSTDDGPVLESGPWRPRVALLPPDGASATLVNLTEDPTYLGVMCNHGVDCPVGNSTTPMREFLSAEWGPEGDLYVAWTDARERLEERSDSEAARITVTVVDLLPGVRQ